MRLLNACFSWFSSWPYRWLTIVLVALTVIVVYRAGCSNHPTVTVEAPRMKTISVQPKTAAKVVQKAEPKIKAKKASKSKTVAPVCMIGKTELPKMPLLPTAKGKLSGMIVVIDPGHGGTDCGAPWAEKFGNGPTVQFLESSYTYRMAWELSGLVRQNGGTVYLTAYSQMMQSPAPGCQVSIPESSDARYLLGGAPVTASNMKPRTGMAAHALKHIGKAKAVVFIALHINSAFITTKEGVVEKNNQRGSFVVVREPTEAPRLALIIGQTMESAGYHRLTKKHGKWSPASNITKQRIRLWVLRNDTNPLRQKLLVEFAEPSMDQESYRMRSTASRKMMLQKCIINGLVTYYQTPVKKHKR